MGAAAGLHRPPERKDTRPRMRPTRLLTLGVAAAALTLTACQGALQDEELALGEASAYILTTQEDGLTDEAVAGADTETVSATAAEEAATAETSTGDEGGTCDFRGLRQRVLEKYDVNGDGKLQRDELRQLREDLAARGLSPRLLALGARARVWGWWRLKWVFDENGDHTLSAEERAALVDALEARCERLRAERLAKYDANHDGTLDDAERAQARADARARWEAYRAELLARYDANGNGVLDDLERYQLRSDRLEAWRQKRLELMQKYDTNGDGTLSVEEALPLRKALQRRLIEGPSAPAP